MGLVGAILLVTTSGTSARIGLVILAVAISVGFTHGYKGWTERHRA
jgi:hypothetical protein